MKNPAFYFSIAIISRTKFGFLLIGIFLLGLELAFYYENKIK